MLKEVDSVAVNPQMAVGWEGGGITSAKGDGRTRKVERVLVSIDDQLTILESARSSGSSSGLPAVIMGMLLSSRSSLARVSTSSGSSNGSSP